MGGCGIGIRELTDSVKEKALELGFSRVGITTCDDFSDYERDVVSRGDDYAWYRQNPSLAFPGAHPRDLFPEGESIIVTAYGFGRFAYPERLVKHIGRAYLSRSYSPLPESIHALRVSAFRGFLESLGMKVYGQHDRIPAREAGVRAGVVTYGNNNFAYTEEEGSFVILYTFIVDAELEYDRPSPGNICPEGCTLCRDVCPTHALVAPGRLKPGRCILKINIAGRPDLALADSVGERIHGCDACQEACPRNRVVMEKATLHDPFVDRMAEVFDLMTGIMTGSCAPSCTTIYATLMSSAAMPRWRWATPEMRAIFLRLSALPRSIRALLWQKRRTGRSLNCVLAWSDAPAPACLSKLSSQLMFSPSRLTSL